MTTSSLSPLHATALVELRSLLDNARQVARTSALAARLTAVVLLDGVIERATHLAALAEGISPRRNATIEELHSQLIAKLGGSWRTDAWPAVRHLHTARNSALHEGVVPDPAQLPAWITATEKYTRSLISTVFAVGLDQAMLSDVIRDAELRKLLASSEAQIRAGRPAAAIEPITQAFSIASERWNQRHGHAHYRTASMSRLGETAELLQPLADLVHDTRKIAAGSTFATDPGDYTWFREVVKVPTEAITPDEVQAALSFVFWWIVRWEATEETFVGDRIERWYAEKRHVRERDEPANISAGKVTQATPNSRTELIISVANVPNEEQYSDWIGILTDRLRAGSEQLSSAWVIGREAQIRITLPENPDIPGIITCVNQALAESEIELRVIAAENKKRADANMAAVAEFSHAASQAQVPDWVGDIYIDTDATRWSSRLTLRLADTAAEHLMYVADVIRKHADVETCLVGSGGTMTIAPQMSFGELRAVLSDVAPTIEAYLLRKEVDEAERLRQLDALNTDLIRALVP